MMKIDLNTCRKGDILTLRNGEVHTYVRNAIYPSFPHVLDNGLHENSAGQYLSSGATSLDVVDIQYLGTVDLSTVKPGDTLVRRDGTQIVCSNDTLGILAYPYPVTLCGRHYDQTGRWNNKHPSPYDIVRILPGEPKPKPLDLSNLRFGDLVECRDGERAIILHVGKSVVNILREYWREYSVGIDGSSFLSQQAHYEVVKILHQHPRPQFQCTATVTVETASAKAADSLVRAKLAGMVVKNVKVEQV